MRNILLLLLLTIASLSGCVDPEVDGDGEVGAEPAPGLPQLHGWVLDPALVPIEGVLLEANAGNVTTQVESNADGFYGFDDLPVDVPVLLIARADGFVPQSKTTTMVPDKQVLMNFSLEREPVIKPFHETVGPFQGFINCQYNVGDGETSNECGPGNNDNQWSIPVGEDFAGGVIEIEWTENTAASHNLRAVVECATPGKCGDQVPVFADVVGPSRLRLEISNLHATKYLPEGGIMLLTVTVDPNNDANEASVGAAFAVSQEFEAVASLFYHAPPPQAYSFDA